MNISNKPVAQGDILIIPISSIPATAKAAQPENGKFVIAHSETGHHHVIDRVKAEVFEAADDKFIAYVKTLGEGAEIKHERNFHTHESINLQPNTNYEVRRQREYVPLRRQREYVPQGFRKAAD